MARAFRLLTRTVAAWIEDDAGLLGAGLATYALLSLAPALLIIVSVAGLYLGEETASSELRQLLLATFGPDAQRGIATLVGAVRKAENGVSSTVLGVLLLAVASTRLFAQLQAALHILWGVRPAQGDLAHRVAGNVARRILSFGLVLFVGVLLIVAVSMQSFATSLSDDQSYRMLLHWGSNAGLATMLALTISLIYRWLPCVRVRWLDVLPGAMFTSALLVLGKFIIGFYLTTFGNTSAYGIAGASIVLMLWMVYSFQIFLMGAEFTRMWLIEVGHGMSPRRGWQLVQRGLPDEEEPMPGAGLTPDPVLVPPADQVHPPAEK
jgi:membrane protein